MKYTILFLTMKKRSVFFTLIFILSFCNSCTKKNKLSFFYVNNEKIELIIPGDTIGLLLKEKKISVHGITDSSKNKINPDSDTAFLKYNYKPVGYMPGAENIKLVLSPSTTKSTSSLEKNAAFLKSAEFNNLVINAGYLARIKKNNKPVFVTNEIIVFFYPGTKDDLINQTFSKFDLSIKEHKRMGATEYLVYLNDTARYDVLETSHKLKDIPSVKFAQVNLIYVKKFMEDDPDPDYSRQQWNINNDGSFGSDAEYDADIDADQVWEKYTTGNANTLIAILDGGFNIWHTDFHDNIFYNQGEVEGSDELDDDSNGYLNDTVGWNFTGDRAEINMFDAHGTAVTGIAAAKRNGFGITGVCPDCKILAVQTADGSTRNAGGESSLDGMAFRYAIIMHAKVINCSWILNLGFVPDNIRQVIDDADTAGIIVVCALPNQLTDCGDRDLYSLPNTICVTRSTCKDIFDNTCDANYIDIAAPTAAALDARGTLKIFTTDITGQPGYNGDGFDWGVPTTIDSDYTERFEGTSASTPQVSGTAALVFSLNPTLSVKQVRYLLQDCADKIDTLNGHYSPRNGFSNFENPSKASTLGYGRLNTFEAIKIAAPLDKGGRNGVDIFLRDNYLDWGNTEQPSNYLFNSPRDFIPHWKSPDIKIDALADATGANEPTTSEKFEDFITENPVANKLNKVYIRVRNRGYNTAENVTVKLYWVYGGLALPAVWSEFPNDITSDPNWKSLGSMTIHHVPYSGSSVALRKDAAGVSIDNAQIVSFDFTPPDPSLNPVNHYCLMATIGCDADPLVSNGCTNLDLVTPYFNNISHKNFQIDPGSTATARSALYLYNPYNNEVKTKVNLVDPANILDKINPVFIDCTFILRPKQKIIITYTLNKAKLSSPTELTFIQEMIVDEKKKKKSKGGYTIYFSH
jgi:subtilisin family serine protease